MDQQVQLTGVLASNPNPNPNQVQLTGVLVSNAWLHARGKHPLPVRHWLGVSWAQRTNPTPNPDPNPNPNPSLNPNRTLTLILTRWAQRKWLVLRALVGFAGIGFGSKP